MPADLQVAAQPDTNKYYVGSGGSGSHPAFVPLDQSDRFNQPQEAKKLGRLKRFWVLTIITIICLAVAIGGGLGAGLHKSNSSRSPHVLLLVPLFFPFLHLLTSFLYLVTRLLPAHRPATRPLLLHRPVIHPSVLHRSIMHQQPSYRSVTSTQPPTVLLHLSPLQLFQQLPPLLPPLSVSPAP